MVVEKKNEAAFCAASFRKSQAAMAESKRTKWQCQPACGSGELHLLRSKLQVTGARKKYDTPIKVVI